MLTCTHIALLLNSNTAGCPRMNNSPCLKILNLTLYPTEVSIQLSCVWTLYCVNFMFMGSCIVDQCQ